jgi:hypothetical protein
MGVVSLFSPPDHDLAARLESRSVDLPGAASR